MTVYVDNARNPYGRMLMCHMHADTLEELHGMADKIGIKRKWFQNTSRQHYDVCLSKRVRAIKFGAKEVTTREIVKMFKPTGGK